jgi:WD40 repeat protein
LLSGVQLEPGLVDAILAEVGDEPGSLPLLSTALRELWEQRDSDKLTFNGYRETGGVMAAINHAAEGAYDELDGGQRAVARRVLLRLVDTAGEDTFLRRRVPAAELAADTESWRVVEAFAGRRLVTVNEDSVEVSHEALFTHWPRLHQWLLDDAEGRAVRHQLTPAALTWKAGGELTADLYRGPRLVTAADYAAAHPEDLTETEAAFLRASHDHAEAERVRQRRSVRRLRRLAVGLTAVIVVAVGAALVAVQQRQQAEIQRDEAAVQRKAALEGALRADSRRLTALASAETRPDLALLMAVEAVRLDESSDSRAGLLSVLDRVKPLAGAIQTGIGEGVSLALSPDDRLAAVAGDDGAALIDLSTRRRLWSLDEGSFVSAVAFSPDSRVLAVAGAKGTRLYDTQLDQRQTPVVIETGPVVTNGLAFLGSGNKLVTVTDLGKPTGVGVRVTTWDVGTKRKTATRNDPDGDQVVDPQELRSGAVLIAQIYDRESWLVDAAGHRIRRVQVPVSRGGAPESSPEMPRVVAISSDGRLIGTATHTRLQVRDAQTWRVVAQADHAVRQVAWSPDLRTLATTDAAGGVSLWSFEPDVFKRRSLTTPALALVRDVQSGDGAEWDIEFGEHGLRLVTVGTSGQLLVWDPTQRPSLALDPPIVNSDDLPHPPGDRTFLVPDSGDVVMVADIYWKTPFTGSTRIHLCPRDEVVCGRPVLRLPGVRSAVSSSNDGGTFLVSTQRGSKGALSWWHVIDADGTVRSVKRETSGRCGQCTPLVSPDGSMIVAVGGDENTLGVWDADSFRLLRRLSLPALGTREPDFTTTRVLGFSVDSRLVVVNRLDQVAVVLDLRTGETVATIDEPGGPGLSSIVFAPDGELAATGWDDGTVTLWHTSDWTELPGRINSSTGLGPGQPLAFAGDNTSLVLIGSEGLDLFDLTETAPAIEHLNNLPASFAPQGSLGGAMLDSDSALVWSGSRGPAYVLSLDLATWLRRSCDIAGRDFTPEEWRRVLPDRPQQPTCLL